MLLLAFLLRLWKSSGTFLNLDEAMHFLAANKPSLAEAYRASLSLAHPPLLILLLNIWSNARHVRTVSAPSIGYYRHGLLLDCFQMAERASSVRLQDGLASFW